MSREETLQADKVPSQLQGKGAEGGTAWAPGPQGEARGAGTHFTG